METIVYCKLIVHNLKKFPGGVTNNYEDISELSNYDLKELVLLDVDEVWYWYATAPYEGSGYMLLRKGNLYDVANIGHCSCYGPVDNIKFNGKELNIMLKNHLDDEYKKMIKDLVSEAKGDVNESNIR